MSQPTRHRGLHPMSMGELLDSAGSFWRANLLPLFRIYLGFGVALFALSQGLRLALRNLAPELLHPRPGVAPSPLATGKLALAYLVLFLAIGLVSGASAWPISQYVGDSRLGREASPSQALVSLRRGLPRFLGGYLLAALLGCALGLLASLPGLAAVFLAARSKSVVLGILGALLLFLGLVGASLFTALRLMLLTPVLALETGSVWRAVRKTGALLSGAVGPGLFGRQWFRAGVMMSVISAFLVVLSLVSQAPTTLLRELYGQSVLSMESFDAVPLWLLLPAELFGMVAQSLVAPLTTIFATDFYLDCRVRREGLDLELALAALPPEAKAE